MPTPTPAPSVPEAPAFPPFERGLDSGVRVPGTDIPGVPTPGLAGAVIWAEASPADPSIAATAAPKASLAFIVVPLTEGRAVIALPTKQVSSSFP